MRISRAPGTITVSARIGVADPVVLKLRPRPTAVHTGRHALTRILTGLVTDDHRDDLVLSASELITNALAAAARYAEAMQFSWGPRDTPIHLGIVAAAQWTRLDIRDPEPYMQPVHRAQELDEHGRGLGICAQLGHLAYTLAPRFKTVHFVAPVVDLTEAQLAEAFPPGAIRLPRIPEEQP